MTVRLTPGEDEARQVYRPPGSFVALTCGLEDLSLPGGRLFPRLLNPGRGNFGEQGSFDSGSRVKKSTS